MSGQLPSSELSPSPPRSRPSGRRRPLQARSDSEINETPLRTRPTDDSSWHGRPQGQARPDDDKVYAASPFPTLESQILQPRTADYGSRISPASYSPSSGIGNPTSSVLINGPATSTPVISKRGSPSSSSPRDFGSSDPVLDSERSIRTDERPASNPALITPSPTIRLVTDDEQSNHPYSTAGSPFYRFEDSSPTIADSPDWPLPTLPPRSAEPTTPTPAQRARRPTVRAISQLTSDAAAHLTPKSTYSANSSGTQVHRTRVGTEELPGGSYLHFADRRERRSFSEPDIHSSSPVVRTLQSSSSVVSYGEEEEEGEEEQQRIGSDLQPNQFSFRRNSSGFPALRRYLEVAEAGSRSSSAASEQASPEQGSTPRLRHTRPSPRNNAFRWSSLMSLSTIPSQPEGTTAPSSIRVISTEPSNLFDESDTSHLTDNTAQSSIRLVSSDPFPPYADPEASTLTQNSNIQSSIRLVSPDPSSSNYDGDNSMLTFQTHQSIRLVEQSPSDDDDGSHYSYSQTNATPTQTWHSRQDPVSSPAWISYSSPVQLPHIAHEAEIEGESNYSPSNVSSIVDDLGPTDPVASLSAHVQLQEVADHSRGSPSAGASYRRRSARLPSQTSPFFHGSSGRANVKQSTIGQVAEPESVCQPSNQRGELSAIPPTFDRVVLDPGTKMDLADTTPFDFADATSQRGASSSIDGSSILGPLRFPAASSSVDNTPCSIHIQRNRPFPERASHSSHMRARTLGSTGNTGTRSTTSYTTKSPRRSSNPVLYYEYPDPMTPPNIPVRPSNPTPGVTPGVTPAKGLRVRQVHAPTLPDVNIASGAEPISYPSVVHSASHLQIPGRVGHRDFSPHLWHGSNQAINRRSMFRPPSVDEIQIRFLSGSKARRDVQIACFALGFLLPILWLVASFLPLPYRGNVDLAKKQSRSWKGKGVIGDPEKFEGFDAYSADEVAGFESARWWRGLNRCLSLLGVILVIVWIVVGVITGEGGIQGPLQV